MTKIYEQVNYEIGANPEYQIWAGGTGSSRLVKIQAWAAGGAFLLNMV